MDGIGSSVLTVSFGVELGGAGAGRFFRGLGLVRVLWVGLLSFDTDSSFELFVNIVGGSGARPFFRRCALPLDDASELVEPWK